MVLEQGESDVVAEDPVDPWLVEINGLVCQAGFSFFPVRICHFSAFEDHEFGAGYELFRAEHFIQLLGVLGFWGFGVLGFWGFGFVLDLF